MSFSIEGNAPSGTGLGSGGGMSKAELMAALGDFLDDLRAGSYRGNEFRIVWDQADEPHVFTVDLVQLAVNKIQICRICGDFPGSSPHIPERRVVGSRR